MAPTRKPPLKHIAEANIALRGPTRSSHAPNVAADNPRQTIAILNTQVIVGIDQSVGAAFTASTSFDCDKARSVSACGRRDIATSFASGLLKTLNAYA